MASIYKKRINNTFLRTLFSDTNYRNLNIGPLISRQLTTKTTRHDITDLIVNSYNKITVPYVYTNIQHLSKLLIILYSKINLLLIETLDDYEEVYITYDNIFNTIIDFEKIYNALYYCLMTTNTNIYKIKKKSIGKKVNYFVYKIIKDNSILYIVISLISLIVNRDPKYKYKLSIDILRPPDTYDDVKKIVANIKKHEKKSSESNTSSSKIKTNTKTKSY